MHPTPPEPTTPCLWCAYFAGWAPCLIAGEQVDGKLAWCVRERAMPQVHARPDHGCAFWRREPGADDE